MSTQIVLIMMVFNASLALVSVAIIFRGKRQK